MKKHRLCLQRRQPDSLCSWARYTPWPNVETWSFSLKLHKSLTETKNSKYLASTRYTDYCLICTSLSMYQGQENNSQLIMLVLRIKLKRRVSRGEKPQLSPQMSRQQSYHEAMWTQRGQTLLQSNKNNQQFSVPDKFAKQCMFFFSIMSKTECFVYVLIYWNYDSSRTFCKDRCTKEGFSKLYNTKTTAHLT